jgi:hypothetical protein
MYQEGDWVVTPANNKVGILIKKHWTGVVVDFGESVCLLHPDLVELAPLDIREDDLLAQQVLAVNTDAKAWFGELASRLDVNTLKKKVQVYSPD